MADKRKRLGPADVLRKPPPPHRGIIDNCAAKLVQVGVPRDFFLAENYLPLGYTDAAYAKLLRPFYDTKDLVRVENLLQFGIKNRFYSEVRRMTLPNFFTLLDYIKSPQGQESLSRLAQKERLERRGGGSFTAKQVAALSMLEAQIGDRSNAISDIRKEMETQINFYEAEIMRLEAEAPRREEEVSLNFLPASRYQPMEIPEYNRTCWNEYLTATAAAGRVPVNLTEASLMEMCMTYGNAVRQRHMLTFLRQDDNEQLLIDYIQKKIDNSVAAGEERAAKRLRGLLEAVGHTAPPPVPPTGAALTIRENPGAIDVSTRSQPSEKASASRQAAKEERVISEPSTSNRSNLRPRDRHPGRRPGRKE